MLDIEHTSRQYARLRAQQLITAAEADFADGHIDELERLRRVTDALGTAYLIDDDPRWGSGFDGDAVLWRQARELVVDAVERDGTFLDVGCANGHLMECLEQWAAERGYTLLLFGLEHNPMLAAAARHRLPAYASRIWTEDVRTFQPPQRFTYVRSGLEYVRVDQRVALVLHLLQHVVSDDGRLIIGPVAGTEFMEARTVLTEAGYPHPTICSATDRYGTVRQVLWIERSMNSTSPPDA